MASPFRVFRRHQKALLVVAGVILILVFVLGDTLRYFTSFGAGGGGSASSRAPGAVAVRWDGGQLTNAELDQLVVRRRVLNAFLRQIIQEGVFVEQFQATQAGIEPRPLRVRRLDGPETAEQGVEQFVTRVRIFAEAAAAAGMSVDDEMIARYLDELGRRHVSRDKMRTMISGIQIGRGSASPQYIFAALRDALLADYYMASHEFAFISVMPQQRWQDWMRVNDRVVIEAAAFPAETFLEKVPEPTPTELSEYYDRYKEFEPRPHMVDNTELPSSTPGFKIPRKVDVQYVRADFSQLLEKIKAEFTEEEIQKFYDDNKDPYFIKPDTSLIDEQTEEKAEGGDAEKSATDEATEESGAAKEESGAERSEIGEVGGDKNDADAGDEQTPATQSGGEDRQTPADEDGAATPAENDRSTSSRMSRPDVFRLAAFAQEESGTAGGDDAANDADAAASASTGAAQAQAANTDAGQPVADAEQPADNAAQTGGGAETPAGEAGQEVADQPAAEAKPIEFLPLDEVRDEIRELLATPKVNQRLDELVVQLQGELTAEFNEYFKAQLDAQDAGQPPPSPPPALADLSGLAEKHALQYRKTGPMSLRELLDDEVIGPLYDIEQSTQNVNVRLLATLFDKDTDLYKPIVTVDIDNNRYVVTKVSDEPARVPPLDEIRGDVVRAWRLEKASELAKKHADDLAKRAEAAGTPLSEFFVDEAAAVMPTIESAVPPTEAGEPVIKVVRTDPFAWLTGGDIALIGGQIQQQPFRLSEPDGIVAAGPEFMQTVFDLDEGRVAAVLNHDHSIAYVVRLVEHQFGEEELHQDYLSEVNFWPGRKMMDTFHAQEAAAKVVTALLQRAQIDWVREPDPIDRNE